MKITRRHVLAVLAGVPVAGGLGVGSLAWRWWDRPAAEGLKRLSVDEHDFAQALGEAWMPRGGTPELSAADARVGVFLDEVVDGMEPDMGLQIKVLLQALDDLTVPTHLSAFRHLPLEARTEVLGGWLNSDLWPLRNGVQALLILLGTGFTTHPDMVEHLRDYFPCGFGR
ncbi:MAG: hypothetical protein H6738_21415 [Alphaproteobacteria bacterium]|nr:hypothetical protein [Alphaproteobacteria bacterium]